MQNKHDERKEQIILQKRIEEQYAFFKKKQIFNIICAIVAIPLYIGGAILITRYLPDKYLIYAIAVMCALVLIICYGIKEIIRLSKKIKELKKKMEEQKHQNKQNYYK